MEKFFETALNGIMDFQFAICCILCFGFNFNITGYCFATAIVIRLILKIYSDIKEKRKD